MSRDLSGPVGRQRRATMALDDSRAEATCFADEVAIDFPSVALAVHRIRQGLLADEPLSHWKTTVRLSSQGARQGATVPLDVPVRVPCRHCGGRGESWTETCSCCMGSGWELVHRSMRVSVPAGVLDGDRLHFTVTLRQYAPIRIELRVLVG